MKKVIAILLGALTLAGCLGDVPNSGPIQYGLQNNVKAEENFVRTIVAPPVPGADPVGIVRGFLGAAAAEEANASTARLFLTAKANREWSSSGERRVIADRSQVWEYDNLRSPGLVVHRGTLTGRLLAGGEFESSSGIRSDQFRLKLVNKEWRIDSLPTGLTITRSDLDRNYRQVVLYFPDAFKRLLIPVSLFVPVRPGLATSLVRGLLAGPSGWLAPSLTSSFPNGSELTVDSVPIVDGIATVGLNGNAATASFADRNLMVAQLTNTLKQIPEFRKLELTAGGAQIPVSSAIAGNYSLTQSSSDPLLYFNTDRDLYSISLNAADALPALFISNIPDATRGYASPSVNADRTVLLASDPAGVLVAGDLTKVPGGIQINGLNPVLKGQLKLTPAQWDLQDRYWVASLEKFSLWVGRGTGLPAKVTTPELTNVTAFAIARDGVRLVVTSRSGGTSEVSLLRIVRDGKGLKAERERAIWTSRDVVTDLHADGAESVAALVGGKKIVSINLRTLVVRTIAACPPALSLAAHPDKPLVVETEDHRLLIWRSGKWSQLTTGRNPSYSG